MHPRPAASAPNEVSVIALHLEIVDRHAFRVILPGDRLHDERGTGASEYLRADA